MSEIMFKVLKVALPAIFLALSTTSAMADSSVVALLQRADAYRLPARSAKVDTDVLLYRDGHLDKERRYTVYLKPDRRTLVLMKSPVEAGQKVLMLGDQFWLLMPESQRPLRITPSQKLLGEASTGDIANMTWSGDYNGEVTGEVTCPALPSGLPKEMVAMKPVPEEKCLRLDLTALREGLTYSRVVLYLVKNSDLPVKADLYVGSGRRVKEAWYLPSKVDGRERIMAMELKDDIQTNRQTLVRYLSMEPKEVPDEFFNPAALVQNSLAGW